MSLGGTGRVLRSLATVAFAGALVVVPTLRGARAAATQPRPDTTLTSGVADPSVTQENVQQTICVAGYTKAVRHVSSRTKSEVFAEYHVSKAKRSKYVIDHLIPLELGGSNDIKNLWPEPKKGEQGSVDKDAVEFLLRQFVCTGHVPLAIAQLAIARDWTTAVDDSIELTKAATTATTTTTTTTRAPPQTTAAPAPQPGQPCPNGTYVNVNGQVVCRPFPSPSRPPPGATAQCNDGTYSMSQNRQGTCSSHGGVRQWL